MKGDKVVKFGNFTDDEYECLPVPTMECRMLNAIILGCTMEGPEVWKEIFYCNTKVSPIFPAVNDRLKTILLLAMDQKLCETINSIFRKLTETEKMKLPKIPTPTLFSQCYLEYIEYREIEAIMDSFSLFCTDDKGGVMQLNNIITFTKKYDVIDIDDEKLSNLPKYLQTLFMAISEDHQCTSPDANRVVNKLYTACVFNSIQVYCHDIKYLTIKVAKIYMSMSPSKTEIFWCYKAEGGMLSWFEKIKRLRVFLIQNKNDEIHSEFHYFTTYNYKQRVIYYPEIE